MHTLTTSKANDRSPEINSVSFHTTYQDAVLAMKSVMEDNVTGTVQVDFGPDSILMTREPQGTWSFVSGEVWNKQSIEEFGQLSTLVVPLGKSKEAKMRLGWGLGKWIREMFTEKYKISFFDEGSLSSDRTTMKFRCSIPRDEKITAALEKSYGCSITRTAL
jgi:hypothetical protein